MAGKVIKLEIGTVYQKTANGAYYFRYQINGQRKAVSLKTKNQKEAVKKAEELIPILKASNTEVISAHVKHAKGLTKKRKRLELVNAWEVYSNHHERATPATVAEQLGYKTSFNELIKFVGNDCIYLDDITLEIAVKFATHLRNSEIAVDTHNRKIKRIKRIFKTLDEYLEKTNPFVAQSLRRKVREEQETIQPRQSFTKAQTQQLLEALEDSSNKVMNKPEIRVIYHLGMFTGQRLKDCVLLRWDKVDFKRKRIEVKQFKTGKEVSIPMAAQLFEVLKEAQAWKENQYVCPNVAKRYNKLDKNGKNVGNNLVNIDVLRVIKWIGIETSVAVPGRKKKVTVYGFHSLRHSFASHCAEAGVPKAVVVSILGANSEIVDKHYTHIGEEAQEKAIHSLFGTANTVSDGEEIEKALALIDSWNDKSEQAVEIETILRDG
jgi:integrase